MLFLTLLETGETAGAIFSGFFQLINSNFDGQQNADGQNDSTESNFY